MAVTFLLLLALLGVPPSQSQTFPARPERHDCILDEAGLLHPEDAQQVRTLCQGVLKDQKIPIVVVTIPSLAKYDGSDIDSYARALFDKWGIGSQSNNYGILLLVSVGDRKARIELGAGWGGTKDETARMVMDDIIVPNFKKGTTRPEFCRACELRRRWHVGKRYASRCPGHRCCCYWGSWA
jgi:uncharacterized protein